MTIEECREYLPEGWIAPIQNDPVLWEIFEEHEYDLEQEAVPPFLIQELRGGNIDRLRPILSLYGQPGLEMLRGLLEIDKASRDTAVNTAPDGQTAYAAYFFARFSEARRQEAIDAVRAYIRAINRLYREELDEEAPLDEDLTYRRDCEDISLLSEALYHISCDFYLSYFLRWPMFDTERENPFRGYFALWKLGLHVHFPARDRAVLVS